MEGKVPGSGSRRVNVGASAVCSEVPGLGFGEIHPTFLRRLLLGDLLSPVVLFPPPSFPLLFLVSSRECVSVRVLVVGVWREILRVVGELARKTLGAHLSCPVQGPLRGVGRLAGLRWQPRSLPSRTDPRRLGPVAGPSALALGLRICRRTWLIAAAVQFP